MLKEDDEIFHLFKEYKQRIIQDAEKNNERTYGIDQMASRLALAHTINKFFIANDLPTAKKINETRKEKFKDEVKDGQKTPIVRKTGSLWKDVPIEWMEVVTPGTIQKRQLYKVN